MGGKGWVSHPRYSSYTQSYKCSIVAIKVWHKHHRPGKFVGSMTNVNYTRRLFIR